MYIALAYSSAVHAKGQSVILMKHVKRDCTLSFLLEAKALRRGCFGPEGHGAQVEPDL